MLRNLGRFTFRVLSGCCVLAATTFTVHAQPLTFTTLAGPAGGPASADGAGSDARFNNPRGVATDSRGNVYVADQINHTIRMITPAGVVTTLAGCANLMGNDDGTGSAARFVAPFGVATDSGGNVYVADTSNNTIRKITQGRVVTTLAGSASSPAGSADGTGSAARFHSPTGVTTDSDGNIYVADQFNNTIRKVTPAGIVTTLAGSAGLGGYADATGSTARFHSPTGMATDSGGNVYIADSENRTIRKITQAGVVTTLAGSATAPAGSDDGTGSAARFHSPTGLATDSGGNVYVADSVSGTIRKITPAGEVTTLAGSAKARSGSKDGTGDAARFRSPTALATDSDGSIYVADSDYDTIRKITPAGVVTTLAGSPSPIGSADGTGSAARFNSPVALAADSAGNVYVADQRNDTIRKITPAGVVTTLAGSPGNAGGSADGTGSAARFFTPAGVATDSDGNVYVADQFNNSIRKITPAGVVTTLPGSATTDPTGSAQRPGSAAHFQYPTGVATDRAGDVYVADRDNYTIRKITPKGMVTTLAGSAGLDGSADGTRSVARFSRPTAVATDSGGNIYVAEDFNSTIRKITPAGIVTTLAGSARLLDYVDGTGSAARFNFPMSVATDGGGNVYVAERDNATIRKITPAGVVTTLASSLRHVGSEDGTGSVARFNSPMGVATDRSGNVYVADTGNNKIRIGRPALADVATIDIATGAVGGMRQLGTYPQTATSWRWRIVRQPAGSRSALSSASMRNPSFIPDVADLYVFQLTASDGVKTSITTVSLTATEASPVTPGSLEGAKASSHDGLRVTGLAKTN